MRVPLKKLIPDEERKNKPFGVTDIEVANWTRFLVAGFFDGKNYSYHCTLSGLFRHIFKSECQDIFAHFGGGFDFLFFLEEILKHEEIYDLGIIIPRGSHLLSFDVTLRETGATCTFRDSSALFPFGLRRLTEAFGVPHKKQEIDYEKITKVTPQLLEYLEYDCKGLYECIEKFYKWPVIAKAGGAYTLAGQAMRVFRTTLSKNVSYLAPDLDQEIRRAYFGGRVEIFKPVYQGKEPLYCYDVNSLYPTVMYENDYPNNFLYCTRYWEPNSMGFYEADVEVPKSQYIPFLGTTTDKFIFPTGKFSGIWTIAELTYAKNLGVRVRPKKGWIFENAGKIFRKYVSDLYAIKQNAERNSVDATIAKLLLNSCYGRFGINPVKENIVLDDGSLGLRELREIKVGKNVARLMLKESELNTFSHVGIAAYVTAYARIFMHRLFQQIQSRLYYTDTDSLFTTEELPTGDGLGKLKMEYKCNSACFLLPKTYIAGEKITMKGFDKKKIVNFTFDDFLACFEGDLKRLKITQEPKFATFRTALRNGALVGMTKASTREIRSIYDKRILVRTPNGWDTEPIHLKG